MKPQLILSLSALLLVCSAGLLVAQIQTPTFQEPNLQASSPGVPPDQVPSLQSCSAEMDKVFTVAAGTLNRRGNIAGLSVKAIRSEYERNIKVRYPDLLTFNLLTAQARPVIVVAYSCLIGENEYLGAFRILTPVSGKYRVVARSEDHPLLSASNASGDPVTHSSVKISPLSTGENAYFLTEWTPAGGPLGSEALVVWKWDGVRLLPIWNKLDARSVNVLTAGSAIFVENIGDDNGGTNGSISTFRLNGDSVLSDGVLTSQLLETYQDSGVVDMDGPTGLETVAGLWQGLGQADKALVLYQKALSLDTSSDSSYLYLTVADLAEKEGKTTIALQALERYQAANKGSLSTEAQSDIGTRIHALTSRQGK